MATVVVTGASGLLGRRVRAALEGRWHTVGWYLDSPPPDRGARRVDVRSHEEVASFFDREPADVCIHCAATASARRCEADPALARSVNAIGTRNVALACGRRGIRLVYVSTDYVFDGRRPEGFTETDPANPLQVYGRTKLSGEAFARLVPSSLIVRVPALYGHGEGAERTWPATVEQTLREGRPLVADDSLVRYPTAAEDVARCIATLLDRHVEGTVHVAAQEGITMREWALRIAAEHRLDASLVGAGPEGGGVIRPLDVRLRVDRLLGLGLPAPPGVGDATHARSEPVQPEREAAAL